MNQSKKIAFWLGCMLSATHSYAGGVEIFHASNGHPLLVAENAQTLIAECEALKEYSAYLYQRNPSLTDPRSFSCASSVRSLSTTEVATLNSIASSGIWERTHSGQISTETQNYSIDASHLIPESTWKRVRRPRSSSGEPMQRPYDGVCYNSTLVHSGIFDISMHSQFANQVEHFIGMLNLQVEEGNGERLNLSVSRPAHPDLISERHSFNFDTAASIRQYGTSIHQYVSQHFTPGSILCLDLESTQTVSDLETMIFTAIESIPAEQRPFSFVRSHEAPQATRETKGGHCFVFMTPNLVVETNLLQPHLLRSWDSHAASFNDLWRQMGTGAISAHYFRINPSRILDWANRATGRALDGIEPFREILREHRRISESAESDAQRNIAINRYYNESVAQFLMRQEFEQYRLKHARLSANQENAAALMSSAGYSDPGFSMWVQLHEAVSQAQATP